MRELYYYFGRDERHNYMATPMGNVLIQGHHGWVLDAFLNSVIVKLIQETNPRDIRIAWYSGSPKSPMNFWKNNIPQDKYIPQLDIMQDASDIQMNEFLQDLLELSKGQLYLNGMTDRKVALYILDRCDLSDKGVSDKIARIMKNSKKSGIYLMVITAGDSRSIFKPEVVKMFDTRICFNMDEGITEYVLDGPVCMLTKEEDINRTIWVKQGKMKVRQNYIAFYPESWLKKFERYYSIWCNIPLSLRAAEGEHFEEWGNSL